MEITMPTDTDRIIDAIIQQITDGRLQPGDQLPSISQLAEIYGTSTATVKIAQQYLRRAGWTASRIGKGVYVADDPPIG